MLFEIILSVGVPYKNSGKKSIPRVQPNQNTDMKIADSVFIEYVPKR